MTQEDKELLLKDLCARLPYVTYYDLSYYGHKTRAVLQEFIAKKESLTSLVKVNTIVEPIPYENIKPYLRPMSSMTGKEWCEYCDSCADDDKSWIIAGRDYKFIPVANREDFLNSHHFDYRGLIEKGLALEAPEGMYGKI